MVGLKLAQHFFHQRVRFITTLRFQQNGRARANRIEQREFLYKIRIMANRRKKTLVEINDVPFGARLEFPAVDLARSHGIHLMGFYLKLLKINRMCPAAFGKQHDLIKSVPMRELNIRVSLYKIADPGNQEFGDTLIGAEQITNTVCWNFLCHSKIQKVGTFQTFTAAQPLDDYTAAKV